MATQYNCTQNISLLVCFAGENQRIILDPKKCVISKENKSFTYGANFKASDGKTYKVCIDSVPNKEKGYSTHANVKVYQRSKLVAERNNIAVRFSRKLFA